MDMSTGDIEDGPAFDRLMTFLAGTDDADGHVYVTVPPDAFLDPVPKSSSRSVSRPAAAAVPASSVASKHAPGIVVVGAGVASLAAVNQLRQDGYAGPITVFGREASPEWHHYDRTKLSKSLAAASTASAIALRPEAWWEQQGVSLRTAEGVSRVLAEDRVVLLDSGERVPYSKLLLATGASARRMTGAGGLEGADAGNVFVCHDPGDAAAILEAVRAAGPAADVVVVGGGFIGMEVAASLAGTFRLATPGERGVRSITVVCSQAEPMQAALGEELGKAMRLVHESNGVSFRASARAMRLRVDDASGAVSAVDLRDGTSLPSAVVVLAVGSVPNTELVAGSTTIVSDETGIHVDSCLRADGGRGDVFAAGDVASLPNAAGLRSRAEHWNGAIEQGRCAGRNMLAESPSPLDAVAFFSTGQFGKNIRVAGHASSWDTTFVVGDLEAPKATVFYGSGDEVVAVATFQDDPNAVAAREVLRRKRMPAISHIQSSGGIDLVALASSAD